MIPSTNHASPTGSLPFLLPALPSIPDQRLDTRPLLPIPSSRLETYAARHTQNRPREQRPTDNTAQQEDNNTTTTVNTTSPHRREQAYQALLDTPIRNAWLYTLYLSPANEALLRKLYLRPVSRASLIQRTILSQLRRAARAEIAKTTNTPTSPKKSSWSISFGDEDSSGGLLHELLTWAAVGGQRTIDPGLIYAEAQRAFEALEAALSYSSSSSSPIISWFFNAPQPTLFDAAVFSYTYLLLASPDDNDNDDDDGEHSNYPMTWGDDTLGRIVREECPKVVAHARRIIKEYWGDVQGLQVP